MTIGSGTVTASIPAGVCTSVATSIANTASTSTDNTVTYAKVLDDFNRANSSSLGSNWTESDFGTGGNMSIASNKLTCTTSFGVFAVWNTAMPAATQFASIDNVTLIADVSFVLCAPNAAITPATYYAIGWRGSLGRYFMEKIVSGSNTSLATTAPTSGPGTTTLYAEVKSGGVLRLLLGGTLILTYTDSSPLTGLYAGVFLAGNGAAVDNFAAGAV